VKRIVAVPTTIAQ